MSNSNAEMKIHRENDKLFAPFLLAASFNKLIEFAGSSSDKGVLYWQFYPQEKAQELIEQLRTKTEPHIPAKDLYEATEAWWKQIAEIRNGERKYGANK